MEEKSVTETHEKEKATDHKGRVVVFRIPLSKCYLDVQIKLTGDMRKSNIDTEALVLSDDRVLNFSSAENRLFQEYFLHFFPLPLSLLCLFSTDEKLLKVKI